MTPSAEAERAIAWRHAHHARICDRIEPWAHGTAVRTTDMPDFYEFNSARLEGPDPGLGAAELAAAAEPALAGLRHRRIEVEDETAGARLWDGFRELGWVAERLAYLRRELPGPAVTAPEGAELRLEGFEATRPLRRAWRAEDPMWGDPPEFVLVEEDAARRRGMRAVVGYVDGGPAGFAAFTPAGDGVEIELVFSLADRRNAGLGGALVARALEAGEAAGAREAFIEADDHGDAKRLYERLGFRTVWRRHVFTKVLEAPGGARARG